MARERREWSKAAEQGSQILKTGRRSLLWIESLDLVAIWRERAGIVGAQNAVYEIIELTFNAGAGEAARALTETHGGTR